MKKNILISSLFVFFIVVGVTSAVRAVTPEQMVQYLAPATFNVPEQAPKTFKNVQLQLQNTVLAVEENIQAARQKYTEITGAVAKQVDAFKKELNDTITFIFAGQDNKSQARDETAAAQQTDSVQKRVEVNMENNYQDEKAAGAEAEHAVTAKRQAVRQEANKDKLARLLVMKHKLPDIAERLDAVSKQLKTAIDAANANQSSSISALQLNFDLRMLWYEILALQMQIETYNLDARATQGLASMSTVNMELEYKDEYLIKIKK